MQPIYEPEALERCVRLRVPLQLRPPDSPQESAAAAAASATGGNAHAAGGARVGSCGMAWFDETKIWEHYDNVSGQIWFFDPTPPSGYGF